MMKKIYSESILRKTVLIFSLLFLGASFQVMAFTPAKPCVCADDTRPFSVSSDDLACGAQCHSHKGIKKTDLNP